MKKICFMLTAVVVMLANMCLASETVVVTKTSDTEVTLTKTAITKQLKVPLKRLKQIKAQLEARKSQMNIQIDEQIAVHDKAIKDAEAQGVVETVVTPK